MEMPAHILDGQIKDMVIETSNPSMEGKNILTFQVERVQIFTPL
jgi:hypothetical protein